MGASKENKNESKWKRELHCKCSLELELSEIQSKEISRGEELHLFLIETKGLFFMNSQ